MSDGHKYSAPVRLLALVMVAALGFLLGLKHGELAVPALPRDNASHIIDLEMSNVEEFRLTNGVHCAQTHNGITCNWAEMNKGKEKPAP